MVGLPLQPGTATKRRGWWPERRKPGPPNVGWSRQTRVWRYFWRGCNADMRTNFWITVVSVFPVCSATFRTGPIPRGRSATCSWNTSLARRCKSMKGIVLRLSRAKLHSQCRKCGPSQALACPCCWRRAAQRLSVGGLGTREDFSSVEDIHCRGLFIQHISAFS